MSPIGGEGVKKLRHPRFGPVEYSHVILQVADNPDQVLVTYSPAEDNGQPAMRAAHGNAAVEPSVPAGLTCRGGGWVATLSWFAAPRTLLAMRRIAWGLAGASVVLTAVALAFGYLNRSSQPAGLTTHLAWVSQLLAANGAAVVGAVIASRRPGNRIGWLALGGGVLLCMCECCKGYGVHALIAAPGSLPPATWSCGCTG